MNDMIYNVFRIKMLLNILLGIFALNIFENNWNFYIQLIILQFEKKFYLS